MNLRHVLCVILSCATLLLTGCGQSGAPASTEPSIAAPTSPTAPSETEPAPVLTEDPPKTLKVLAIGGSFSMDTMQYLYQIAEDAGVEEIVLGNMFLGGGSLSQHLTNAKDDAASYDFYKNTDGTWVTTKHYRLSQALVEEDWDYITLQQVSSVSGLAWSYNGVLTQLIDYVQEHNSTAKLVWHMTWAYQHDSNHSEFVHYDKDPQKMYDMIVQCVHECVLPDPRISFVIPAGTAIQNARTSFLGDTLTRDGFHLDRQIGRYIAGMAWYAALTNSSVDNIDFNPAPMQITADMLAVARESAINAMRSPYAVTQSEITEGVRP